MATSNLGRKVGWRLSDLTTGHCVGSGAGCSTKMSRVSHPPSACETKLPEHRYKKNTTAPCQAVTVVTQSSRREDHVIVWRANSLHTRTRVSAHMHSHARTYSLSDKGEGELIKLWTVLVLVISLYTHKHTLHQTHTHTQSLTRAT